MKAARGHQNVRRTPFTIRRPSPQARRAGRDAWRRCRRKARWHFRHDGKRGKPPRVRSRASDRTSRTSGRSSGIPTRARRNRKTRATALRASTIAFDRAIAGWLAPCPLKTAFRRNDVSRIERSGKPPVTKIVIEPASFVDIQKRPGTPEAEVTAISRASADPERASTFFQRDGLSVSTVECRSAIRIQRHHLESASGGSVPNNLISRCARHATRLITVKDQVEGQRGHSFRAEAFMGIMRWTLRTACARRIPVRLSRTPTAI